MSAPRVLVSGVVLGQPAGGVRRHNQELLPRAARLLAAAGGALAVLEGKEPVAFELPPEVERIPSHVPPGPPLARALQEGRALAEVLRGHAFDLVHTAHLPVPRRLPLPFSLTLHDLRALELRHTPFSRRFFAKHVIGEAVARASTVIAVSETVARALAERFRPRRLAVVPNAGDHLAILPRARADGAALLHVGHLEPRKNLELLVRALALDPALPDLELAGRAKDGEDERLRALARELGVEARVRFLGPLPDERLPELYARCAAVVIPSRLEGFGIGVLEAQRARAPLAIADAGALPEVAGADVPRFDPDDPAACAHAIRAALAQPRATLEDHASRGGRFTWDASAERLVEAWTAAVRRTGA